jgi:hypothetical protein
MAAFTLIDDDPHNGPHVDQSNKRILIYPGIIEAHHAAETIHKKYPTLMRHYYLAQIVGRFNGDGTMPGSED